MSDVAAPYLSLDDRVQYLRDRGYTTTVSESARDFLGHTNFHYFLGYARNFRRLVNHGTITEGDLSLDRVIAIVELDHELSGLIFGALGRVEWLLRAHLVEAHCSAHPSTGCFLTSDHFVPANFDSRPTHDVVREQIARCREPWVLDQYKKVLGREPSAQGPLDPELDKVLDTLPIWSVVDSWTIGLLARVIIGTRTAEGELPLWKNVAGRFEISNQIFDTQLTALVALRNLVAHHSRLWMRPTTSSAKIPKRYGKLGRGLPPKALYVTVLALADFLRLTGDAVPFLDEVDRLLERDPAFALGIRQQN